MRWPQALVGSVVCGCGAALGLFEGFAVFAEQVGNDSGATLSYWIVRPDLYWRWPTFGAVVAGLGFWAVWFVERPLRGDEPATDPRVEAYRALIGRAVAPLRRSDRAGRHDIYDRARRVLDDRVAAAQAEAERGALEAAIRMVEQAARAKPRLRDPRHRPTTAFLVLTLLVFGRLWMLDVTSMSLYWVARLPRR